MKSFKIKINIFFFVLPFLLKATYDVFSSPTTSDEPEISEPHTGTPASQFFLWMPGILTVLHLVLPFIFAE